VALVVVIQTIHPQAGRFAPTTGRLQQLWYRAAKRFDLERENLQQQGARYFRERGRRVWDTARARVEIALERLKGDSKRQGKQPSLAYILESLGTEHDKVFEAYHPSPYGGDVVLFRATKQLRGLLADRSLGWKETLRGAVEVCEVHGHQQNMLLEPNVQRLADELKSQLRAAQIRSENVANSTKLGAA
jgi:thioesterase domain-containing protein